MSSPVYIFNLLKRDPVVWVAVFVTGGMILPYLIPLLSAEQMETYAEVYSDTPPLLVTIAAFQFRLRQLPNRIERRFWNLLTLAFACWLLVRVSTMLLSAEWYSDIRVSVVHDSLYASFYLFMVLALELCPDVSREQNYGARLRSLRSAGAIVFAFGLLIYFAVIPGAVNLDAYDTWVPSLLLFVVLDVYLVLRLMFLRQSSGSSHWKNVYSLLLLAGVLWMITDVYEGLSYMEAIPYVRSGTLLDLVWFPPALLVVCAARLREVQLDQPSPSAARATQPSGADALVGLWGGPLVVYAFAFPSVHLFFYSIGVLDPASKSVREICALTFLLLLAAMAFHYQKRLESEHRRLEAAHEAMNEQLRRSQRMEAVGQLTGGLAHDFNNILTVIKANTELVRGTLSPALTEEHAELQEVAAAAQRGAELVSKLLGFSRRGMLSIRTFDLTLAVEELSKTLRRLIPENIEIRCCADGSVPMVRADSGAMDQILLNLATNARDAMPNGGLLRIETRLAQLGEEPSSGEYVCIEVSDTGEGMDDATKARIFEPFFTTKQPGKGSGLGMSMVFGLVGQQGGFVEVDSRPGEGTRVKVYLPPAREDRAEEPPKQELDSVHGGTETILVVEDEVSLRRAMSRVLECNGYTVVLAKDGAEGLETFRRRKAEIDLVISDVVMPKMSGPEFYEIVRNENPEVPFMFTSGYTDRGGRPGEAVDPDAPFLSKPWTITELLTRVREVLDR